MADSSVSVVLKLVAQQFESGLRQVESGLQGFTSKVEKIGTVANALVGGALAGTIASFGKSAVNQAIQFESAFAGVRKTVEANEQEFQALAEGFTRLSQQIPVAREEFAKIGESAGQLGIAKDAILTFSETIAKLAITTNLTSEQAATAFARIANIMQVSQADFDKMGAALVALGNAGASTESEITEMALRIAGAGKTVGLSADQVLAIANALSSVGIEAEAGGSAISRVMVGMAQAVADGGAKLQEMAKVAGMSSAQFQKAFQEDAAGALVQFIEGLGKVKNQGENVFAVLEELGLKEVRVRDALLRAANAGDLFRQSLELGAKAWQEHNALNAEAEKRFATTESQLQTLTNSLSVMAASFGEAVLPAVVGFVEAVKPAVMAITDWAKANPELVQGLFAMAGVLGSGGALLVGFGILAATLGALGAVGGPIVLTVVGITALVGGFVAFRKHIGEAYQAVKQFIVDGLGAADRFISTMAKGLQEKLAPIAKAAESIATAVAKFLKPGSPTEEGPWSDLDEWGGRFIDTIAGGIEDGTPRLTQAAQSAAERAKSEMDIRGSIPIRQESGRFSGSVSRTGTTFGDGLSEGFSSFTKRAKDSFAQGVQLADAAAQAMARGFETFFFNVFEGKIRSMKDLLRGLADIAKEFSKAIIQELARIAAVKTVGAIFGAFGAHEGGVVRRFAIGGAVVPYTNGDSVPALLTPGEYVVRKPAVDQLGLATMDLINAGLNRGYVPPSGTPDLADLIVRGGPSAFDRTEFGAGQTSQQAIKKPGDGLTVNIINSGRTERPDVNFRRELHSLVVDIIWRDVRSNGSLRPLFGGAV